MKNILITDEQIKQYKKGFLLIKNFFDKHEVISIKNQINRKIKQKKNKNFYFEKNKNRLILRRIEKVSDYSKSCRELLESKKLIKVLEQLQKKKVKLFKDKLNFKYPGGKGFAPHIDGHFYWKDKNNKIRKGWNVYSKNFINAVIPLEKSDNQNHKILRFPLLRASVKAYISNLNTHNGYKKFRAKRSELRKQNKPLTSKELIDELDNYAQTGKEYTKVLHQIIEQNDLHEFETVTIDDLKEKKELKL